MCDYSLHHVASRPAKIDDKLVTTMFKNSVTRGFAAVREPDVAVCLLPGTEIAFDENVRCDRAFGILPARKIGHQRVSTQPYCNCRPPHMPPKRKESASPRFRLEQADTLFKTESRWHSRSLKCILLAIERYFAAILPSASCGLAICAMPTALEDPLI